jgi:hypothetical protein
MNHTRVRSHLHLPDIDGHCDRKRRPSQRSKHELCSVPSIVYSTPLRQSVRRSSHRSRWSLDAVCHASAVDDCTVSAGCVILQSPSCILQGQLFWMLLLLLLLLLPLLLLSLPCCCATGGCWNRVAVSAAAPCLAVLAGPGLSNVFMRPSIVFTRARNSLLSNFRPITTCRRSRTISPSPARLEEGLLRSDGSFVCCRGGAAPTSRSAAALVTVGAAEAHDGSQTTGSSSSSNSDAHARIITALALVS